MEIERQRPVGNGFGNERAVTGCFRGQQMDSVDDLTCPNETARHSVEKPERFHTAEVTGSKPVAPTKEDLGPAAPHPAAAAPDPHCSAARSGPPALGVG